MSPKGLLSIGRMILGYSVGIVGFATLSMGFVHLSGSQMLVGLLEIATATAATLGLLVPLRRPPPAPPNPDGGSTTPKG